MIGILKNHYEKIILSLVLVGLAAAVWFLYQASATEEESISNWTREVERRKVKGTPEDPTELIVELTDTKERVSVAKGKDFKRPDGFEVDLRYPVENKEFKNLRKNSSVTVAGDQYNIVAISENEVVLSARLNDKKYTIRQMANK